MTVAPTPCGSRTADDTSTPEDLDRGGAGLDLLSEWMEALPCIALLERGGEAVAVNTLARTLIGTSEPLPVEELFAGAYPPPGEPRRQRFHCLLCARDGRRTLVSGAVQPFPAASAANSRLATSGSARLVLLMEPAEDLGGNALDSYGESDVTFLQDLFDHAPEAMVIVEGVQITHVNHEFLRLFGYPLEVCLGGTLFDLIIPEALHHESEILLHDIASTGHSAMDTVRRTSSGEELDVTIIVRRVRLGAGRTGLSVTYRDIRQQKRAEARLQHAALHDGLTGLANRGFFLDRLSLTMARLKRRPDRNFAVVFLDVDRFKQVNDSYGHATGDALLLAVTDRLRMCLRPQDTIARFGGDEFALLLDEVGSTEDIAAVARRIQDEMRKPVAAGGREVFVSASMGIALGSVDYEHPEEIMRDADEAMYRAKAKGKARHEFFSKTASEVHPENAHEAA